MIKSNTLGFDKKFLNTKILTNHQYNKNPLSGRDLGLSFKIL